MDAVAYKIEKIKQNKKTAVHFTLHWSFTKTKSDVIPPLWPLNGSLVIMVQGKTTQWSFSENGDKR